MHARADKIEPEQNRVLTDAGDFGYDYLVIATGPHFDWDAVPGMGPHGGYTQSICSLPHAMDARKAWREFLKDPGRAEYEMVFNVDQAGIREVLLVEDAQRAGRAALAPRQRLRIDVAARQDSHGRPTSKSTR